MTNKVEEKKKRRVYGLNHQNKYGEPNTKRNDQAGD